MHTLLALLLAAKLSSAIAAVRPSSARRRSNRTRCLAASLTPAQNALVDKAIVREKEVIKVVKERAPLVETYIQNMKPDPILLQIPESDEHHLARVDFGKVINDDAYKENKGNFEGKKSKLSFFKNSFGALGGISSSLRLTFHESGFVQMILMDSNQLRPPALQLYLYPQRLSRQHPHGGLRRLPHQRQA